MESEKDPKHLPNREAHYCFGCSPANPSGLQMKFYTQDSSVYSRLKVPDHLCGWDRLVHGGVISTILDEIMSWSGIYLLKQITMTKSMTVDFIKPVYINSDLKAEGKVLEKIGRHEACWKAVCTTPRVRSAPGPRPPLRYSLRRLPKDWGSPEKNTCSGLKKFAKFIKHHPCLWGCRPCGCTCRCT